MSNNNDLDQRSDHPSHVTSLFNVLADELGAVAGRIEREAQLKVGLALAEVGKVIAELRAENAEFRSLAREALVQYRSEVADLVAKVDARLSIVRDGKNGIDGKAGTIGPAGPPGESIVGPKGDQGEPGIGLKGDKGDQGEVGKEGAPGLSIKGDPGEKGEVGKSGAKGDPGERGEKGESIIGPLGLTGERGPQGEQGERGKDGESIKGEKGEAGTRGEKGAAGEPGQSIIGPQGVKGEPGQDGAPGKLPKVKKWKMGAVSYEGDVVTFDGSLYQAQRDTAMDPFDNKDWVCLAISGRNGENGKDGRSWTIRGTYDAAKTYQAFDVVTKNSMWFVAVKDNPGDCPGTGWQGGPVGKAGKPGERGEKGSRGEQGPAGREIIAWSVDNKNYSIVPIMSDGSHGEVVVLRDLFERFLAETR
jgi:hypothetical protein